MLCRFSPPHRFVAQRLEAAKRKQDRAANINTDSNGDGDDAMDDEEQEDSELDEDELEARKAAEYFEDGDAAADSDVAGAAGGGANSAGGGGVPFQQLNISRPLLRAVEAMGYVTPTSVQQRAVPFALAGRCVVWCSGWL